MQFKKTISSFLMASVFASHTAVFVYADASVSPHTGPSPEVTLLLSVIALEGANPGDTDIQQKLASAISEYANTASQEGQKDRMEQALVTMGIYSQDQAEAFVQDIQTASSYVAAADKDSNRLASMTTQEVSQLIQLHPVGAQFSNCEIGEFTLIGALGAASLAGFVDYAVVHSQGSSSMMGIYVGLIFGIASLAALGSAYAC